jgi:hypothetical protein
LQEFDYFRAILPCPFHAEHGLFIALTTFSGTTIYSIQGKDYLAVVRGAPSRAWLRQQPAREGAPRTTNNIFLNAIPVRGQDIADSKSGYFIGETTEKQSTMSWPLTATDNFFPADD